MMFKILRNFIPNCLVNNTWHLLKAILANIIYQFPSKNLKIIGVTGTDGKTTTANIIYHLLYKNGFKVALISTIGAKIDGENIDTGFHVTSPDSFALQKLLKKIADKKLTHIILEVTSHGLDQYRFWGVDFFAGILTNISKDHLDYHKTLEKYASAKLKLFKNTKIAILNIDDKSYEFFKNRVSGKVISYGKKTGDFNLKNHPVKLKMIGLHNQLNALAAIAIVTQLDLSKERINLSLSSFPGVLGRMQVMQTKPYLVVVDFAHTPNGLKTALEQLKPLLKTKSRLISVFGCAGDRDKNRRQMGFYSAKLADITIITAEDPRFEGVEKISQEISKWAEKGGAREGKLDNLKNIQKYPIYVKIPERLEAIRTALKISQAGDVIGIFGKGHERSMCFGNKELPWSDQEEVNKIIKLDKIDNSKRIHD